MAIQIRRREFIAMLGGAAAAWPLVVLAQQSTAPMIGFLTTASVSSKDSAQLAAFHAGLRDRGYTEGKNVTIEYRWANNDYSLLPVLARELVERGVAVIVAAGGYVSAHVAQDATSKIPIVFTTVPDPVKDGLVASLNRPGGNATGTAGLTSELDPKRLELLHEIKPTATVIGVLVNPNRPGLSSQSRDLQIAANKLNLKLDFQEGGTDREIDKAYETFASRRVDAILSPPIRFSTTAEPKSWPLR